MAGKEFISIKKAAQLTGQSEHTLLKLWNRYQSTTKVKEKNGKRYISQALLKKKLAAYTEEPEINNTTHTAQKPPDSPVSGDSPTILGLLTQQLQEKDKQLSSKDTQIAQLIERTREQNNIIFSLEQHQQQLESKLALQIPAPPQPDNKESKPQINYVFIALIMLLVGVVLIIFYTFLNS
ncbi:hypothetical protein GXP67_10380 [Rhodocytophaga rosea]|uniref:Uncharacterized protein n=1 Tax=Rhodocytophaga rosea TaxID=2704465 RepID=A0A6C0GGY3_9BACT|nr:hypothetical protein [Rhodocytophaga rosea]QHT67023.1 hypothetical protein GXP67_10380 [Rhodocytophaga rosea]